MDVKIKKFGSSISNMIYIENKNKKEEGFTYTLPGTSLQKARPLPKQFQSELLFMKLHKRRVNINQWDEGEQVLTKPEKNQHEGTRLFL